MMLAAAPTGGGPLRGHGLHRVTTVCGIWLAYGEPPNLIMKANLYPLSGQRFFSALLRAGGGRQLSGDCLAIAQETRAASRSIWKPWMSSMLTPRTCGSFKPPATAK